MSLLPPSSGRLLIAMMMEAARTSETMANFYQTTWRYNPEDSHLRFALKLIVLIYLWFTQRRCQ
jgi:hypothetical protein